MTTGRTHLFADSIGAAVITALLSGPVFVLLMIALLLMLTGKAPNLERVFDSFVVFSIFSIVPGLAGGVPAAIVNSTILFVLARKRVDGLFVAIASGAACGVLVAPAGLHFLVWRNYEGYWGRSDVIEFVVCLAATGSLMGLLHWIIAVRPYRRWRLQRDREAGFGSLSDDQADTTDA